MIYIIAIIFLISITRVVVSRNKKQLLKLNPYFHVALTIVLLIALVFILSIVIPMYASFVFTGLLLIAFSYNASIFSLYFKGLEQNVKTRN